MRDLLRRIDDALSSGSERIVCQVVETKGSTPQKAGALMVVDPDGGQVGTLGGGCVENEVKMRAVRRVGQEGADVHSFVLDHDYAWADGLICGGKMTVVVESASGEGALEYYRAYRRLLDEGRGFTEAVAVDAARSGFDVGNRCLFDADGKLAIERNGEGLGQAAAEWIAPLAERPRPGVRSGIALLPTLPRVRLVVVGAGHVGQAVADLAAQADFDVWVVDDRKQYANRERFPRSERIVVGPIEETLSRLDVDERTYAVIVTRGHGHDQEALFHLAPTPAPYVGLIGSRRKIRLIFEGLRGMGVSEADLARVAAPVGIDIGSETVVEIAVSIVAELIARRNLGTIVRTPCTSEPEAEPEPAGT
ncbi:MAG TPA: XdhC family protein [Isosphaeraceae bacterium]|nr:XdhC family protein [Isosphaeraceae bacterium]